MDARTARIIGYGVAGVVALFAFPAFLSTLFADSGPYDQLLEMSEPPTCTYRQSLGPTPPAPGERIDPRSVAVIGVGHGGSIPPHPRIWNLNSDLDALGSDTFWGNYDARGYQSMDVGGTNRLVNLFVRPSLEVPHGTEIRYLTTTTVDDHPESGDHTSYLLNNPYGYWSGITFSEGFFLPETDLAVGLGSDSNSFLQAAYRISVAVIASTRTAFNVETLVPIAMRPGTIQQLKDHLAANGIDPDRCDATAPSYAAISTYDPTATDATSYYSGVVAMESYGSVIAVSPFRGVIAAMISFLPLLLAASGVLLVGRTLNR